MLYLFIYLAGIIDTLKEFIEGALSFLVPILLITSMLYVSIKAVPGEYPDPFKDYFPKFFKFVVVVFCVVSLLHMFVPSKATVYQIAGVYCGKQINQQVHIDKKLQKISEIIDLQLDRSIKELQKNN